MKMPPKYAPEEAKRIILLILKDGYVGYSFHCLQESMSKQGVTTIDVVNALQCGQVLREPEWDDEFHNWKYRVEGRDAAGRWIAIIFAFKTFDLVFLITVFSIEARGKK